MYIHIHIYKFKNFVGMGLSKNEENGKSLIKS